MFHVFHEQVFCHVKRRTKFVTNVFNSKFIIIAIG